tara:strand:+ start:285 stop:497 length:213 start_codon:yes stop_codon:yes gene_type:complete
MKINKNVSTGNIVTIFTMVVAIALSYGRVSTRVDMVNAELIKKAEKEVIEVHFEYIQKQLDEIKVLIKER